MNGSVGDEEFYVYGGIFAGAGFEDHSGVLEELEDGVVGVETGGGAGAAG